MMSRKLRLGLGLGCLAALLILVLVAVVAALGRIPPVEEQVTRGDAVIHVSLRDPGADTTWLMGLNIQVYALVTGAEPITSAELWANGGLIDKAVPGWGASSGHVPLTWDWNPVGPGDYTLVVRAQDARGRTGVSGPVQIHVSDLPRPVLEYSIQLGDTLEGIAHTHGLPPEQIAQANPSVSEGQDLLPGSWLKIPLPPLAVADVQPPAPPDPPKEPGIIQSDVSTGKLNLWLAGLLGSDDHAPVAPTLTASVEACDVLLTFTDSAGDEAGFFVYRASESQPALARIATLPPQDGGDPLAYSDPGQSGLVTYVVAAFNSAGEAASNPATVKVTKPACAPAEPGPEPAGEEQVSPPPSSNPDLAAPEISVVLGEKCTVLLTIVDQSDNEDGFHVYLKPEGEAGFSSQGMYWDRPAHDGPDPIVFDLDDQHGHVSYYVSAFNAGGESPSNVAEVYLYDDCSAGHTAWDKAALQKGMLDLDPGVTLAYFYSRAAQGQSETYTPWSRTPADPAAFLPVNGQPFDLYGYLGQTYGPALVDPQYAYFLADVELWGWAGGALTPLGTIHLSIAPNVLLGCPDEDGCLTKPGYGGVTTELTIAAETKVRRREFYWLHDTASAGPGIWQLSRLPFADGYDLNPPGLLASGSAEFRTWIDFNEPDKPCSLSDLSCFLGSIVQSSGDEQAVRRMTPANIVQGGDYYVRVIPASPDPQGQARITNTVLVHVIPTSYQPNLPSMGDYYTVEIVDLVQPKLVNPPDWGCVILKQDWTFPAPFGETIVWGKAGERICPPDIPPKQDCDWGCQAEAIAGGIEDGYNWVGEQIEKAKDLIVGFVADVANEISPGLCSEKCKGLMKAGLNAGIAALTGLPPSLPNLEDVANEGLDYAIDYAAGQVGADCNDKCKEAFRTALGPLVDQLVPSGSSPSIPECGDSGLAAQYGKLPLCFTNDMAEPVPSSHYEPAVVILKVRRGTAPVIDVKEGEFNYVRIDIGGFNSNTFYAGKYFDICSYRVSSQPETASYYPEGDLDLNYAPNPNVPMTTDEMYETQVVSLPWLEPGQEVTIPVVLKPVPYRYHQGGVSSKCPSAQDWPYLFYAGVTRITAAPVCAPNLGSMDPTVMACGTADHKEFDNPIGPETYVAPLQAEPAN